MNKHLEDDLQIAVAHRLSYCPNLLWFHVPNGGKRNIREAARLKRMGVLPGVADIIIHWRKDGSTHRGAIELKVGKNKQTQAQSNFEQQWKYCAGGQYALCYSLDDLERILKAWGVV